MKQLKLIFKKIKEYGQKINKKYYIVLLFIILIGSFFYWWAYYETPFNKWDDISLNRSEYYEIKEINKEIIVENKKAGLTFKAPNGWDIKKPEFGNYIAIYSPGAIGAANNIKGIKNGCQITVNIILGKMSIKEVEQKLKDLHKEWNYSEKYEVINVSGNNALKNTTGIMPLDLYGIGVHIPYKKIFNQSKIYYLSISSNLEYKETCFQEFENFLKTVLIK